MLRFRPIKSKGGGGGGGVEFECRQVVFWGTGTKRLGTPALHYKTELLLLLLLITSISRSTYH